MWFCGSWIQSSVVEYLVRYLFHDLCAPPHSLTPSVWREQLKNICRILGRPTFLLVFRESPSLLKKLSIPIVLGEERREAGWDGGAFTTVGGTRDSSRMEGLGVGGLQSIRDSSLSPYSTRTHGKLSAPQSSVMHLLDLGNLVPQLWQIQACHWK